MDARQCIILNLGCGLKTSDRPEVQNIDWSPYLWLSRSRLVRALAPIFLDEARLQRLRAVPKNILVYNLAKGIPYADQSVDVVYHSHVLEHLDRPIAQQFLAETHRVLKPGGILRIVVPDFELLARAYLEHIELCEADPKLITNHSDYIAPLIEQSVRREADGTARQKGIRRIVENLVLGDARKRGETHQWMYDRFSLQASMNAAGFHETTVWSYDQSWIPNWNDRIGLDAKADGSPYKQSSLYFEGRKSH
ncbi:methyltransferase domain-containing protein [Roseobacter sp. HKCCD9010]|uniref:class I SAM-dependent methyltransferase n=1 Tax=unclassified Roseobacter TaxID=196798 RepID=UPI00149120F2|nr:MULTISPECIES: class I SAM-dependent methyltransferase [unclassified Roseobacter]MBF9050469.1 methyltransferase domain-containing protein [Rhodobacterales bacterium HKCCD4356]NNV12114.1 methyltransferase domain-containing protein [Roseobacter sp. HKCCD7357]NNV17128.1 methyltransferase domain-containing protein [Roseobacter sp. HKCCD8768]NNV26357.1 methyltransferase domain-containing protein [Roseobacter sp. HKCCD8192]NNV30852.1 methyltransferase domain-containing protein [Roseobacter sp. HKC